MPDLITETLLVVTPFKDRGTDFVAGDRVPIHHLRVRQIAAKNPSWFRMEYATEELDLEWLSELDRRYEEKYRELQQAREEAKARQRRALRQELESQDRPQPELERLFKKQEAEDRRRQEEAREEREREKVERDVALIGDGLIRDEFNF